MEKAYRPSTRKTGHNCGITPFVGNLCLQSDRKLLACSQDFTTEEKYSDAETSTNLL